MTAGHLMLCLVDDAATHCVGCGLPVGECDGRCTGVGEFEAPRHCPYCGRRLAVQVTPTGVTARCRDHGPLPPAT